MSPDSEVPEVAGVEPIAIEQAARLFGVVEVALRRRRPAELDTAFATILHDVAGTVDDAHLVAGKRLPARDHP